MVEEQEGIPQWQERIIEEVEREEEKDYNLKSEEETKAHVDRSSLKLESFREPAVLIPEAPEIEGFQTS